ncbi:MAG: diguanylate cyclase domain-containing protein [Inhella sp.]
MRTWCGSARHGRDAAPRLQRLVDEFDRHLRGKASELLGQRREFNAIHRDGRRLVVRAAITEVSDAGERLFVGVITDITEQRAAESALRQANVRVERLSATDPPTALANRRRLMEQLQQLWQHGLREQVAVLLVDVDHFKLYNDHHGHHGHHGHQAGDAAPQAVAGLLNGVARRATDLAARYGGEEFLLLLDHCDLTGARELGEELLTAVRGAAIAHGNAPLGRLCVSRGCASRVPSRDGSPEDLMSHADTALYRAKAGGRDCAVSD